MQPTQTKLLILFTAFLFSLGPAPLVAADTDSPAGPNIAATKTLDLDTACKIALADNPSLAAAAQRVEQARQQVNQARAAYWPNLVANGSVNRVKQSENLYQANLATARAINPLATIDNPEDYYQAGLSVSWTLFDGFRRHFSSAAAKHGEAQSQSALLDSRRLLLSAVSGSFYRAQLASEGVTIAIADEAFNLKQVSDANARLRVGTGALSDVLNFEIQANAARDSRINADNQYITAMTGLAALLGIPHANFPEGLQLAPLEEETVTVLQQPDVRQQIDYAHRNRPDILAATQGMERAAAGIKTARARYYPNVVLSGTLNGERSDNSSFEGDDFGNTVGVFLTYDLFSGGADRARVTEAKHIEQEAIKNQDALKISVANEVSNALTGLRAAQQQLELQRKNASLVRRNRDLVEKEYAAGQASLVRLNEAQRNLIQAQSRLAYTRLSLRSAWATLHTTTAKNLEQYSE
ncbi:MAG: TolC family protein [Desulfobacterales bacterium]|nr:TolC family protein [Desulfobacterales bacterium]